MYWRCVDRSCLGRATTDKNDQVIAENHAHDHPPETAQMTVAKVVEKFDSVDYILTLLHLNKFVFG